MSNSSSSSFILAVPKGTTIEEIKNKIKEKIGIKNSSVIFPNLANEIADEVINDIEKLNLAKDEEDLREDQCYMLSDEQYENLKDNKDVYYGLFSDNGDGPINYFMCLYSKFIIDEEDFFWYKEETGY